MAEGLQVINDGGIVQIDSTYRNQKLLYNATIPANPLGGFFNLTGIIDPLVECPLVFIRTTGIFGGFDIRKAYFTIDPARIVYHSSAPVDIAIFSASAPDSTDNAGFQVFDSNGVLVYNSANRYARIQDIVGISGNVTSATVGFTPQSVRPWICANPLLGSLEAPLGSGSEISVSPWMICVTYTNSSLTMTMPEYGNVNSTTYAPNTNLSQYNGRTLQIPIGIIPGL